MIFLAFLEILVSQCEPMVGRLQPMILEALRTTLSSCLFVLAGSTTIPDQDGEGEHAFDGCTIKMGHACLTYPKLPQLTEEVYSLMGFGNNKTNVQVP